MSVWKLDPDPLEEQSVFVTIEPSLQPCNYEFLMCQCFRIWKEETTEIVS